MGGEGDIRHLPDLPPNFVPPIWFPSSNPLSSKTSPPTPQEPTTTAAVTCVSHGSTPDPNLSWSFPSGDLCQAL